MVENVDFSAMVKSLSAEFDALIDERQQVRAESEMLKDRADEIERKLKGIQTTLQGLMLYTTAQEVPTELMKKTTMSMAEAMKRVKSVSEMVLETQVAGPDVKKTLTECCRDILRQRKEWMSPVQVRDALYAAGFDFSNYTSNPLSSIHTTLKRMVPEELLTETRADGQMYRWALDAPNTPGTELTADDPARKLVDGARFPKREMDSKLNAAFESGMRGNEKPKR